VQALNVAVAALAANVETVVIGKSAAVRLAVLTMFAGGHLLIEDVPGVGKTVLAKALARSIGGSFRRVQGTPDLLPSDITGVNVFDQRSGDFTFQPGPVFANVVLVDEINRVTPRTQSSLMEAMEERQVTTDGLTRALPVPFLVIATQNPLEHHGTFPLPEGQLDRFTMAVSLGYPDRDVEREIAHRQLLAHPLDHLEPVMDPAGLLEHQARVRRVHVDNAALDYAAALVGATRTHPDVAMGASPRATIALVRCAQVLAAAQNRAYVLPDDIKVLAAPVVGHRLILPPQAKATRTGQAIVEEIAARLPVPLGAPSPDGHRAPVAPRLSSAPLR